MVDAAAAPAAGPDAMQCDPPAGGAEEHPAGPPDPQSETGETEIYRDWLLDFSSREFAAVELPDGIDERQQFLLAASEAAENAQSRVMSLRMRLRRAKQRLAAAGISLRGNRAIDPARMTPRNQKLLRAYVRLLRACRSLEPAW